MTCDIKMSWADIGTSLFSTLGHIQDAKYFDITGNMIKEQHVEQARIKVLVSSKWRLLEQWRRISSDTYRF